MAVKQQTWGVGGRCGHADPAALVKCSTRPRLLFVIAILHRAEGGEGWWVGWSVAGGWCSRQLDASSSWGVPATAGVCPRSPTAPPPSRLHRSCSLHGGYGEQELAQASVLSSLVALVWGSVGPIASVISSLSLLFAPLFTPSSSAAVSFLTLDGDCCGKKEKNIRPVGSVVLGCSSVPSRVGSVSTVTRVRCWTSWIEASWCPPVPRGRRARAPTSPVACCTPAILRYVR